MKRSHWRLVLHPPLTLEMRARIVLGFLTLPVNLQTPMVSPQHAKIMLYQDFMSSFPVLSLEFCRSVKLRSSGYAALFSSLKNFGVQGNETKIELGALDGDLSGSYYLLKGGHRLSVLSSLDEETLRETKINLQIYNFCNKKGTAAYACTTRFRVDISDLPLYVLRRCFSICVGTICSGG